MTRRPSAGGWGALAVCLVVPLAAAGCRSGTTPASSPFAGLDQVVAPGETMILARRLPADQAGATTPDPKGDLLIAVVRMADGHEELRVAASEGGRYALKRASRAGDEFKNLAIEDVNADGRPEIVSRWLGGQLDVVEVLGRDAAGAWIPLLQNAGQSIEERRRADQSIGFWITSRTYEEGAGLPPIYDTHVWRWDGKAFTEEPAP